MEKTIVHEGKKLFYKVSGEGRPVVLLHGFAENGSIWEELAGTLRETYTVLTPDLPGSGQSELTPELSMESMARAVKAILDYEHIIEAVIIGYSMGGYVSLAFAEQFPFAISALGLFHSSGFADDEEKIASRRKNIAFIGTHGTRAFLKQATPTLFSDHTKKETPGMVDALIDKYSDFNPEALTIYQQAMITRPDRLAILENIVKPVLMIIGKEDKAIPYDLSLRQSHLPSCAYLHVLEKSGHMGMQEEFDKSRKILQDFLRYLPESPGTDLPKMLP